MIKSLSLIAILALAAGCSRESKAKDAALEAARTRFETKLRAEADEKIAGRGTLPKTYVHVVKGKTEYEVDAAEVRDDSATVLVRVRTIPPAVRSAALDVIARHDPGRDNSLNISDIIALTAQQLKLNSTERAESLEKIMLKDDNGWKAVTPAE